MEDSIRVDGTLLIAEQAGLFDLAEAMNAFRRVVESIVVHRPTVVLVDARRVTGYIDTLDRFQYGEFIAAQARSLPARGVLPMPRFAYVLAADVIDPQRVGETAAVNRGMLTRAFTDLDEALNWLRV